MSENDVDDSNPGERALRCPTCGKPHSTGDRYCADCGAALTESEAGGQQPDVGSGEGGGPEKAATASEDRAAWLLTARPAAVIGGGLFVLLLAVALLAVGQLDRTGTLVMLSICVTPLALITVVIGLARFVASRR